MDPRENPYTPNAGAVPPELAGRLAELRAFDVLLERLRRGLTPQSLMLIGHRGMGKTALLESLNRRALGYDWVCVEAEFSDDQNLERRLAQVARRALLSIAPVGRWKEGAQRAAAVLTSFSLKIDPDGNLTAGLGVDAARGTADSGVLESDLTDLLVELGNAARDHGKGVVLFFDELQHLQPLQLSALLMALHKIVQKELPLTLVGAGLPVLRRRLIEARSYAERLFDFPQLGLLNDSEARAALMQPAIRSGLNVSPVAADVLLEFAGGYPYFLQEIGSVVWDHSAGPEVSLDEANAALVLVERKLDAGFFKLRAERATPTEREFLLAMDESAPASLDDVAFVMGRDANKIKTFRASLISKGLIQENQAHELTFTVPGFGSYLRRASPMIAVSKCAGNAPHQTSNPTSTT